MNSLTLFSLGAGILFFLTIFRPFFVLPIFIFGSFIEPMQYFPELTQYNPTTLLGGLIVLGLLIHNIAFRDAPKIRSKQVLFWWFFMLWIVISSLVHHDTGWAPFLVHLRTFIPYILFLHMIKTKKQLKIIILVLLLFGVISAIYGMYQIEHNIGVYDRGVRRITGFFSNPNHLSNALLLLMPLALGLLFYKKYTMPIRFGILGIIACLITGIVISYSRKTFFGLVVAVFFSIYKFFKGGKKIVAFFVTVILLLGAAYFFPTGAKYHLWARVRAVFAADSLEDVDRGRTESTKAGWQMMLENPIFGVGFGGFVPAYAAIASRSSDIEFLGSHLGAHNVYVEVGGQLGIVGLILYLVFIFFAFKDMNTAEKTAFRNKDDFIMVISASLQSFLLVFLFIGFFSGILTDRMFWMVIPISVVAKRLASEINSPHISPRSKKNL